MTDISQRTKLDRSPTWISGELMHEVLCHVQADSGLREELDELLPQLLS